MAKQVIDHLIELDKKIENMSPEEVAQFFNGYDTSAEAVKHYAFLENCVLPHCAYRSEYLQAPLMSATANYLALAA